MPRPKHTVFQEFTVKLDEHQAPAEPYDGQPVEVGGRIEFVRLPRGTKSGRSSVFIDVKLDDGTRCLLEMSMRSFATVAGAFQGAEQRDGIWDW